MCSSISNPLAFFEDFFPNGFVKSILPYLNVSSDTHAFEVIDDYFLDNSQSYTVNGQLKGESKEEWLKRNYMDAFEAGLRELLEEEINTSIRYTHEAIQQRGSSNAQKTLVHTLFYSMSRIINQINEITIGKEYILLCQSLLVRYIQDISKKYPSLIEKTNTSYKKYLLSTTSKEYKYKSLKMIDKKFEQIKRLYDSLVYYEYIDETLSIDVFKKAFDNTPLNQENQLKISWKKDINGETVLQSIIAFIQLLEDKKYIDTYKPYDRLSFIFVKSDGSPIKHWRMAKSSYKETLEAGANPDWLDRLKKIISSF